MTILKRIAHPKLSTRNPGTRELVARTNSPLRRKVKRPRVIRLIGRVRMIRIGLIIALIIPKTTPTTIAVKKLSIWIPGRIYEVIITESPLINKRMNIFI